MTDTSWGNLDHKAETIPEQEGLHDYISSSPSPSQTKRMQKDGWPLYSCEISRLKKVDILVVHVVGTGNQDQ